MSDLSHLPPERRSEFLLKRHERALSLYRSALRDQIRAEARTEEALDAVRVLAEELLAFPVEVQPTDRAISRPAAETDSQLNAAQAPETDGSARGEEGR